MCKNRKDGNVKFNAKFALYSFRNFNYLHLWAN